VLQLTSRAVIKWFLCTYVWLQSLKGPNLQNILWLGTTVFCGKFFQIPRGSLPNSAAHRSKFTTYGNELDQICSYLSPVTATDRYSLSTKLTGNISDKLSIPYIKARVAVMYFMVKSWIRTLWRPELHQNMPYLSPYHCPVPNSAKFRENIEILRKWANSVARLKILRSAENCGPYLWSSYDMLYLLITIRQC